MIRFYKTPLITRAWYPSLIWNIRNESSIFLTFDDGPHPEITPWVLNELEKVNAKATFFCLGKNMEQYPEIAHEILRLGHRIGNHTYSHLNGWKVSDRVYQQDISLCDEVMGELNVASDLFRPPHGRLRKSQIKGLLSRRIVMWSHLSWDFDSEVNPGFILKQLKKAQGGSILLFHDSERAFGNLERILPEVLAHFNSKGLKFDPIK